MLKKDIVKFIYENDVLRLGTVILKNGDYSDHIYDFGRVSSADRLSQLAVWMVDTIGDTTFDAIFTSAYKGIVLSTAIALEYQYRFPFKKIKIGFSRKEVKDHGEGGIVVGYHPRENDRVLLIDDVLTTGTSLYEMVEQMHFPRPTIAGALVVVTRAGKQEVAKIEGKLDAAVRYLVEDSDIIKSFDRYWGKA